MANTSRILLFLLLLGVAVLFNFGLVDVRIDEIRYLLGKITSEEDVTQTLGIPARYELTRRRIAHGEDDIASYELEAKIAALTSGDARDEKGPLEYRRVLLIPVRMVLNVIRILSGEEILKPVGENQVLKVLKIAYFWERNRKYAEAIGIYNEALNRGDLTPEVRAAVLVHKAFCHSMISEYETARSIYERVISTYPRTQAGILSWRLLEFVQSMEQERQSVSASVGSALEKAKQYYRIMDHRNAIKFFSVHLGETSVESATMEARFFKGRAHEELGEIEEAIAEYNRVIARDVSKEWAKKANRRLLMLGEFYEHRRQMAQEARKQLATYQDVGFMNEVQRFSQLMSESSLWDELIPEKAQASRANRSSSSDSLLAVLNQIDLDLTGDSERKKQEKLDKMRARLMSEGKITQAEIKDLDRRRHLRGNPHRRPLAIKEVIDENSSQLRYLYNRRLRLGAKFTGRMEVEIVISPNGTVENARTTKSSLGDAEFEREVIERIREWRFKEVPESLGILTVNYPIDFTKEE